MAGEERKGTEEGFVGISYRRGEGTQLYRTQLEFARSIVSRDISADVNTGDYVDICLPKPIEESKLRKMLQDLGGEFE